MMDWFDYGVIGVIVGAAVVPGGAWVEVRRLRRKLDSVRKELEVTRDLLSPKT